MGSFRDSSNIGKLLINEDLKRKSFRNIKGKTLKHNSIFYRFKFGQGNVYKINSKIIQEKFKELIEEVLANRYPLEIFNIEGIRYSDFYIEGRSKERISTNTIKTELIFVLGVVYYITRLQQNKENVQTDLNF